MVSGNGNPGNMQKYWIIPLPGFDEETFPFVVSSGFETLNLINVKTKSGQILVKAQVRNVRSQQAIFFQIDPDSGFIMHFATKYLSEQNKEYHNWHCMPFREDFRKKLMKYGQLPNPSMKDHFEMMQ